MNLTRHFLAALIRLYRWCLSPMKPFIFGPGARCRFTPTCSEYALEAVSRHGAWRGGWLSMHRICRCHPWGGCGFDPVPEPRSKFGKHPAFPSNDRKPTPPAWRQSQPATT